MTITEFLAARLDEDETIARDAWPDSWTTEGNEVLTTETGLRGGYEDMRMSVARLSMTVGHFQTEAANAAHIARHDPARVLAEVAMKRAIVELHTCPCPDPDCRDCGACSGDHHADPTPAPCDTFKTLAQVYAEHEDYDPAWRVA